MTTTKLEALQHMIVADAACNLPRDLGDGLVLRFATPTDVEALAQFNGRIHGTERPDKFDPMVAAWTRDFCSESHPTCGPSNVTLVEDTRVGKIISSMCLIPQTWTYAGIPFGVGRPEAVGTDPDYRRRGLIRMQFEVLHAKSAAMGHLVQGITGIPWYYRQFGYDYALDLVGGRITYWESVPALKEGETEPYRLRPMTSLTLKDDLPFVKALYEQDCARSLVACPRPDWLWQCYFSWYSPDSFERRPFYIIEKADGQAVGYLVADREMWDDMFMIDELVVVEGQSLRAVMPSVLRALRPPAQTQAAARKVSLKSLYWRVGREHPVFEAIPELLPQSRLPYGWYIRVADVPAFLRHIAPALEARLARSPLTGRTGEFKITEYRRGFRMMFESGKLTAVEPWQSMDRRCQRRFPTTCVPATALWSPLSGGPARGFPRLLGTGRGQRAAECAVSKPELVCDASGISPFVRFLVDHHLTRLMWYNFLNVSGTRQPNDCIPMMTAPHKWLVLRDGVCNTGAFTSGEWRCGTMCGRFTLFVDPADLREAFPGFSFPKEMTPRYNIAPSQPIAVVANNGRKQVEFFQWGLVPSWAQDPIIGNRMINARAESLAEKPSFRTAYKRRRCLILADGFYEWQQVPGGKTKTPMLIRMKSGEPFAFAGLWEVWHPDQDDALLTCTIITTTPNVLMEKIHNRMPVILSPAAYRLWLDPAERAADELAKLLKPYPASQMTAFPVSRLVNDPKNDSPECVAPAA